MKMNRREFLPLLAGGVLASARAGEPIADAGEKAAAIVRRPIQDGTLRAACLQIRRGDTEFVRAFGDAKDADAMFLLGSITKPLTAIGAMVLVDRGELRLSDPAVKYLPEFSEGERRNVTIEHLLTHTSGLPDQLPDNNALRARHAPLSDFVAGAARVPLLFQPGSRYHYQSMGIMLAAEIVERMAKQRLPAFLEEQVFRPLGMNRTVLGLGRFGKRAMIPMQTERAAPEAGAGDPSAKDWDWNSDYWRSLGAPWGGAHSTVGDLARVLRYFSKPDDRVLKPETARLMVRDHTPNMEAHRGIGWQLGASLGRGCSERAFGHSGSTGTLTWADPETDTIFAILTSLPKNISGDLILKPVSDLISAS